MEMYKYTRLSKTGKKQMLKEEGCFLEKYADGNNTVFVYYLNGFFVEEVYNGQELIDSIPFKRGYKLNKQNLHAIEKRNILYNLAA
jgi:hypothetical protein